MSRRQPQTLKTRVKRSPRSPVHRTCPVHRACRDERGFCIPTHQTCPAHRACRDERGFCIPTRQTCPAHRACRDERGFYSHLAFAKRVAMEPAIRVANAGCAQVSEWPTSKPPGRKTGRSHKRTQRAKPGDPAHKKENPRAQAQGFSPTAGCYFTSPSTAVWKIGVLLSSYL